MAEADELTAIESERAKQRQVAQLKQGEQSPLRKCFLNGIRGKTRDKVAKKIGIGSDSIKIKIS
jgi:uncharacterized protein YnzC (UPF0291/DUF896 family)